MIQGQQPSKIIYDQRHEPLSIPLTLSSFLFSQDKPTDILTLFIFYYHTAKWQGNGVARATNSYVAQGLGWTIPRVIKAAQRLVEAKLIRRSIVRSGDNSRISEHRIELDILGLQNTTLLKNNTIVIPITKERSLKSNILKKVEKFDPTDLPVHLDNLPTLREAWLRFVQHRKEKHCPITPTGFKRDLTHMASMDPGEVATALDRAVDRGWRGWYFPDSDKVKAPTPNHTPVSSLPSKITDPGVLLVLEAAGKAIFTPIDVPTVSRTVKELFYFYNSIPTPPGEGVPHMTWKMFLRAWLEFLTRDTRFPVRALRDFEPRGNRWEYFIRQKGEEIGIDLRTGKKWRRS